MPFRGLQRKDRIERDGRSRYGFDEMVEIRRDLRSTLGERAAKGGDFLVASDLLFTSLEAAVELKRFPKTSVLLKTGIPHREVNVPSLRGMAGFLVDSRDILSVFTL